MISTPRVRAFFFAKISKRLILIWDDNTTVTLLPIETFRRVKLDSESLDIVETDLLERDGFWQVRVATSQNTLFADQAMKQRNIITLFSFPVS